MKPVKQATSKLYRARRELHQAALNLLMAGVDRIGLAEARVKMVAAMKAASQATAELCDAQESERMERGT